MRPCRREEAAAGKGKVDEKMVEAWRTVRALDCARCHGEPSLLTSVKERDAESFKRLSLEGNAGRGMPPYKSNERAVKNIDAIHAYFKGLADGTVPKGNLK